VDFATSALTILCAAADKKVMRRIPTLDGWRAIAILCVMWHHTMQCFFTNEDASYLSVAHYGAFGVDIFFGLSGLLITGLLLKQRSERGAFNLKAFYTRRAFRILPVYLLFLAVIALIGLMHGPRELVSCLLFVRNYVPNGWIWGDTAHLWSLSVEEHFYLIWPSLLVLCGLKWGRHVAAYCAIAIGFWRLMEATMYLHLFPNVLPHLRTDLRLDALLWGAVVAFTLNDPSARERLRRELKLPVWAGLVVAALLSIAYYSNVTSIFLAVLIPIILSGTLLHPDWLVSRLLDSKAIAWIGRISYSLYIWQQLFLVPGWEQPSHFWTRVPWNVAAALAAACVSFYLLETPFIRLGGRLAAMFSFRRETEAGGVHANESAGPLKSC
jgi:peptidoglycan/LPS O-acetylase OafA/YrhL